MQGMKVLMLRETAEGGGIVGGRRKVEKKTAREEQDRAQNDRDSE